MRVGVDARALQPGFKEHLGRGIGLYAAELVRALTRLGGLELVLHFDPWLAIDETRVPAGVARAWYPRGPAGRPLHHHFRTQFLVPAALDRRRFDLFHFPAMQDAPFHMPCRCAVTVHDVILFAMQDAYQGRKRIRYRMARTLERAVMRHAAMIVTDSEASRADILRLIGIRPAGVRVAPLGVDARFAPHPQAEIDVLRVRLGLERPYLLYLGGIDARKNVPRLIEAYARVRQGRDAPPDLVLAGAIEREAGYPALRAWIDGRGLGNGLRMVGYVADADLPALLSGARAFVFPSLYEGFGLPPLEAMASGTPVVASDASSLPEVLGDAALQVPGEDVDALASAIGRVLDEPALASDLRRRGLERAASFTWERTARATVAAYQEALR